MCSCGLYIILKLRHNQLKVPCSEFEDAGNVLISCWNKHKEALDGMYSVIMNLKPAVEALMLWKKNPFSTLCIPLHRPLLDYTLKVYLIILWQKIVSYGRYSIHRHTHLVCFDAAAPPLLHATRHQAPSREIISVCKETQSARLNALVLEGNSVTTMAESERPVVRTMRNPLRWRPPPFLLLLLLLSRPLFFLPFSNFLEKNKHRPYCLATRIWTLQNTRGLHRHANTRGPRLTNGFLSFHPSLGFFFFLLHFREQSGAY